MDNKEDQRLNQIDSSLNRIDQAITGYEQTKVGISTGESTTPAIDTQKANLVSAELAQNTAQAQLNTANEQKAIVAEGIKKDEGSFLGLGKFFGRQERNLKTENIQTVAENMQSNFDQSAAVTAAQKAKLEQVTTQQISRQDELIDANKRMGPLVAPGSEVFARQDQVAERAKSIAQAVEYYKENVRQVDNEKYMIPMDKILVIKESFIRTKHGTQISETTKKIHEYQQKLEEATKIAKEAGRPVDQDYDVKRCTEGITNYTASLEFNNKQYEAEANTDMRETAILYQAAIKYAENHDIVVTEDLLVDAIKKATLLDANRFLSQDKDGRSKTRKAYFDFLLTNPDINEVTWHMKDPVDEYSFSAFLLKGFAEKNNLPQDETLIPYAIAFVGGLQGLYDHPEETLQHLLVDLLPLKTTVHEYVKGEWTSRDVDVKAAGLGSQTQLQSWDSTRLDNTTDQITSGRYPEGRANTTEMKYTVIKSKDLILDLAANYGTGSANITGWKAYYPHGYSK